MPIGFNTNGPTSLGAIAQLISGYGTNPAGVSSGYIIDPSGKTIWH